MCEEHKNLLIKYLRKASIFTDAECVWDIECREPFGRCLVANRDIQVNELILYDKALVLGPRITDYKKIFCISCYKVIINQTLCPANCKFPVCSDCVDSENHKKECDLIRSWGLRDSIQRSKHLFRALTAIRGLLLSSDDSKLMNMMACHENTNQQNLEMEKILGEFEGLTEDCETVLKLKKICSLLNANAFEVMIAFNYEPENSISLRGLYPLAALMNHNCVPNCRYTYDSSSVIVVNATKFIKKGEQIFDSYIKLLWGTKERRVHLAYAKKFLCKCERCLDPTELGSYISALKCPRPDCESVLLPINPLAIKSPWCCKKCELKLDHGRITRITDILSMQITNKVREEPMSDVNHYLKEKLSMILPASNQLTIEVKLQIIFKMKHELDYKMTLTDYEDIERYCYDVIEIIERLSVGEVSIKGLLYYEILTTKMKICELRNQMCDDETRKTLSELVKQSWQILKDTTMEPKDLRALFATFK